MTPNDTRSTPPLNDSLSSDELLMQRCLDLAQQAQGRTAPNPMVGCVIVRDGQIVGEGFHPAAGQPHAEVFALREAGETAQGATAYVSLEPCNHYGRTPPCTEALIAAGVAKVVVGMVDPNPIVAGRGIARLREAGIEVVVGVLQDACQQLNEAFIHRVVHCRPFGILKYAMTLDGKIATRSGHSAWITEPTARQRVYALRSACDAVIVGSKTVRHDNPSLTTHGLTEHNPLRVVMSRGLDLPLAVKLWHTEVASTLVLTETTVTSETAQETVQALQSQGVEVITVNPLTPASALQVLYDRGLSTVLWECGGTLAAEAIALGCVQKVWAFIAPKIIGGEGAPTPVGELGFERMTEALPLARVRWEQVGQDLLLEGYLG